MIIFSRLSTVIFSKFQYNIVIVTLDCFVMFFWGMIQSTECISSSKLLEITMDKMLQKQSVNSYKIIFFQEEMFLLPWICSVVALKFWTGPDVQFLKFLTLISVIHPLSHKFASLYLIAFRIYTYCNFDYLLSKFRSLDTLMDRHCRFKYKRAEHII